MRVTASQFADPADVRAYYRAKKRGLSDRQAFALGDNGIGCWGDCTAQLHTAMVALPPEDMQEQFGSVANARHALVNLRYKEETCVAILADRMPRRANIKNGAGIDLNPACIAALGIPAGAMVLVDWSWS